MHSRTWLMTLGAGTVLIVVALLVAAAFGVTLRRPKPRAAAWQATVDTAARNLRNAASSVTR